VLHHGAWREITRQHLRPHDIELRGARRTRGERGFLKDLGIAVAEAEAMGLDLPGLSQARRLFERVAATLGGEVGT
jgi:3-hydroxyisobutyrate dehydrogenase-like beta-hydroxyacid dehydrogenase